MTIQEKAIAQLERISNHLSAIGEKEDYTDVAIQALEQVLILDKIRAEIENHCGLLKENHCRYCSYCNNLMGVREILQIIDKYKAESEE